MASVILMIVTSSISSFPSFSSNIQFVPSYLIIKCVEGGINKEAIIIWRILSSSFMRYCLLLHQFWECECEQIMGAATKGFNNHPVLQLFLTSKLLKLLNDWSLLLYSSYSNLRTTGCECHYYLTPIIPTLDPRLTLD